MHILPALKDAFISFCPTAGHSQARLCWVAKGASWSFEHLTSAAQPVATLLGTVQLLQPIFTAASPVLVMPHYNLWLSLVKCSLLLLFVSNCFIALFLKV